jgi:hypothetical protein
VGSKDIQASGLMTDLSEPIESCKTCRFWQFLEPGRGICRRNSPLPRDQEMGKDGRSVVYRVSWPETHEADWCGEFARVKKRPPPAES